MEQSEILKELRHLRSKEVEREPYEAIDIAITIIESHGELIPD